MLKKVPESIFKTYLSDTKSWRVEKLRICLVTVYADLADRNARCMHACSAQHDHLAWTVENHMVHAQHMHSRYILCYYKPATRASIWPSTNSFINKSKPFSYDTDSSTTAKQWVAGTWKVWIMWNYASDHLVALTSILRTVSGHQTATKRWLTSQLIYLIFFK